MREKVLNIMRVLDWKKKGTFYTIDEEKIFVIDEGKSSNVLVILHGYPTSSYDYHKVLHTLSKRYRVVIHDHLGFGFSNKPRHENYSLVKQAERALMLWEEMNISEVTLLAHDYGTSVATEIIARINKGKTNLKIEKLILCNGSIHIEYSQLRTIQKLLRNRWLGPLIARVTNYSIFQKNIRNIYFDQDKLTEEELKDMWYLLNYNKGKRIIHQLTQYITERYTYWDRWVGALKETQIPTKIVWAINDPIAIPIIAETLSSEIPKNQLLWMDKTGHFLMLEKPEEWCNLILREDVQI